MFKSSRQVPNQIIEEQKPQSVISTSWDDMVYFFAGKIGRLSQSHLVHLFPPAYLLDTIEFPWMPLFKDPGFLHQKYVVEGLTADEVAALCFSAKSTVLKHLRLFGIPVRETNPGVRRHRCVAFGQRMAGRQLVEHRREQEALHRMHELRAKGFTYENIAEVLNSMGVRTKTGRGRWYRKTVQAILMGRPSFTVARNNGQK